MSKKVILSCIVKLEEKFFPSWPEARGSAIARAFREKLSTSTAPD